VSGFLRNVGLAALSAGVGVAPVLWAIVVSGWIDNRLLALAAALAPIIIGGAIVLSAIDRKYK
jgi:hypothetical protein